MLQHIEGALAALPYPERPEGLYDPIRFILAGGGKRLRPMLLLTAYSLYHSDFTPGGFGRHRHRDVPQPHPCAR